MPNKISHGGDVMDNDYIYEGFSFEEGDVDDLIFSPLTTEESEK